MIIHSLLIISLLLEFPLKRRRCAFGILFFLEELLIKCSFHQEKERCDEGWWIHGLLRENCLITFTFHILSFNWSLFFVIVTWIDPISNVHISSYYWHNQQLLRGIYVSYFNNIYTLKGHFPIDFWWNRRSLLNNCLPLTSFLFIGPESDHCLPL